MRANDLLGLSLLLVACDDPLKSVELVAEPRVLGARVEVMDDPARAAPGPGESASVSFLLAAPELAPSAGFALGVCSAAARQGGRSACESQPFAELVSQNGEVPQVRMDFDVPQDIDPSGRLLVLGVICPNGSPNAAATSCAGADTGTPVTLELELARDDDVNHNPELEPDSLSFDEQDWPEQAAVDADCAGLGYPEVPLSSDHSIQIRLDAGDRDPLPHSSRLDPTRESLQLSHFATGGDLSRAFQSIAWDSDELLRSVTWTAPKEPGLVRFWLVLRDFRGGGAFLERSVCVQ